MRQYCRYCLHLVYGDVAYCQKKKWVKTYSSCKCPNKCKDFELNSIDALGENTNGYKPRAAVKTDGEQMHFFNREATVRGTEGMGAPSTTDEYVGGPLPTCQGGGATLPRMTVENGKAVLMSIHPRWCAKIFKFLGYDNRRPLYEKRLELRKSKPVLQTPFKVYIYVTKTPLRWNKSHNSINGGEGGFVKAEFVCDYILSHCEMENADVAEQMSCVPREDIFTYSNGKEVYGWHISELVIYDKLKEITEFTGLRKTKFGYEPIKITRPPQSWCYVEELKGSAE